MIVQKAICSFDIKIRGLELKQSLEKTNSKESIIEVFGLGYVGFPLSIRLANSGFKVRGIDTDEKKIENLKNDILKGTQSSLKNAFLHVHRNCSFVLSKETESSELPRIGIICVPTPVSKDDDSNRYVNSAIKQFLSVAKKGDVIILESSIIVGTTDKIKEIVESQGFKVGQDFGLCFCPERIDPLNKKWNLENVPRVISSYDDTTFDIAKKVYEHVNNSNLVRVSSPKVAEIVKSFENAFRLVNISLVNELAMLCDKLNINVKEVIDAAATKPFGFIPFYSGAGAGGHCIPKDPRFLTSSAKKLGMSLQTIENAIKINQIIPKYIVDSIENELKKMKKEKSVLVCGLSYKPDIEDMRDSPGFKILYQLKSLGFTVAAYDPFYKNELCKRYLQENNLNDFEFTMVEDLNDVTVKDFNCICIVQNHTKTQLRLEEIYKSSMVPFIYDCQNRLENNPNSLTVLKKFGS